MFTDRTALTSRDGSRWTSPGVTWEAFLGRVRERVAAEIERAGVFRIGNQVGIFTCR